MSGPWDRPSPDPGAEWPSEDIESPGSSEPREPEGDAWASGNLWPESPRDADSAWGDWPSPAPSPDGDVLDEPHPTLSDPWAESWTDEAADHPLADAGGWAPPPELTQPEPEWDETPTPEPMEPIGPEPSRSVPVPAEPELRPAEPEQVPPETPAEPPRVQAWAVDTDPWGAALPVDEPSDEVAAAEPMAPESPPLPDWLVEPLPKPVPEPVAEPEPEAEPEPGADAEPVAEPEPEAEPEPGADAEPVAEPEPQAEPEPWVAAAPPPEPSTEPDAATPLPPLPEAAAEAEPIGESEAEEEASSWRRFVPWAAAAPALATDGEPTSESESEAEAAVRAEVAEEAGLAPATEAVAEPDLALATEAVAEPDLASAAEAAAEQEELAPAAEAAAEQAELAPAAEEAVESEVAAAAPTDEGELEPAVEEPESRWRRLAPWAAGATAAGAAAAAPGSIAPDAIEAPREPEPEPAADAEPEAEHDEVAIPAEPEEPATAPEPEPMAAQASPWGAPEAGVEPPPLAPLPDWLAPDDELGDEPVVTAAEGDVIPAQPEDAVPESTQVFPSSWAPPPPPPPPAGETSRSLEPAAGDIRTRLGTQEPDLDDDLEEQPSTAEQAVPWLIGFILLLAGMVIVLLALIFAGDQSLGAGLLTASASASESARPSASAASAAATPTPQQSPSPEPSATPAVATVYGPLEMIYQGRAAALAPIYLLRHDFTTEEEPVTLAQDPSLDVRRFAWTPDGTVGAGLLSDVLVSIEEGEEKRRLGDGIMTITFGDDASTIYAVRVTQDGANDVATVLAIDFESGDTTELASINYPRPDIAAEDALVEAQFADDGGAVRVFWMEDDTLRLWALGGGTWTIEPEGGAVTDLEEALPVLWSADGSRRVTLEAAEGTTTITVLDEGGDPEATTSIEGLVSHLRWSPTGDRVAFTLGRSASGGGVLQNLFLWDLGDGDAPTQLTATGAAFGIEWRGTAPVWRD
jgi:hypothetical protein